MVDSRDGLRRVEGLKLPVRGKAVWKLADGDLEYVDVTITQLQYDRGLDDLLPDLASKRRA